jgi:hypothetical protein
MITVTYLIWSMAIEEICNHYMPPDFPMLDQWCDLGVAVALNYIKPSDGQLIIIKGYPDIHFAFDLGYRAGLYRDSVR